MKGSGGDPEADKGRANGCMGHDCGFGAKIND